ncbi:15000_t:CDS:2 [Dentiscutata erythropus]|uniref:15000_t:CDS:1 n=1 Tax=Dentiscutata erythropus TaxID=1348616 RepID=A0A9N9DAU9_9GLOM|nr:15000_t:CDS:2 [Dentiscutata erythropus]
MHQVEAGPTCGCQLKDPSIMSSSIKESSIIQFAVGCICSTKTRKFCGVGIQEFEFGELIRRIWRFSYRGSLLNM